MCVQTHNRIWTCHDCQDDSTDLMRVVFACRNYPQPEMIAVASQRGICPVKNCFGAGRQIAALPEIFNHVRVRMCNIDPQQLVAIGRNGS